MDEELEKRIFPTRRFDHLTLEGQKLENKGMGFIRLGRTDGRSIPDGQSIKLSELVIQNVDSV